MNLNISPTQPQASTWVKVNGQSCVLEMSQEASEIFLFPDNYETDTIILVTLNIKYLIGWVLDHHLTFSGLTNLASQVQNQTVKLYSQVTTSSRPTGRGLSTRSEIFTTSDSQNKESDHYNGISCFFF